MIEQRESRFYSFVDLNISHQLAPTILVICFSTIRYLFLRISLQAKTVLWQLIYDLWSVTDLLRWDLGQRVKCGGSDLSGPQTVLANKSFSKINIQIIQAEDFVTLCLKSTCLFELTLTLKGQTKNFVKLDLRHTTKKLVYWVVLNACISTWKEPGPGYDIFTCGFLA